MNSPVKVGILGLFNRGKSFLLSLISESKFPSGFRVQTKGLSLKIINENILLMDTAGFETSINIYDSM